MPELNGPSEHLSWAEMACKDGTQYPDEWRLDRAARLAEAFERVRALYGGPLIVLSAYRTPSWNKRVGGAKLSQHVQGRALDLAPATSQLQAARIAYLDKAIEDYLKDPECQIRGVGIYPTFRHIDVRPTDRLVRWNGSRPQADAG